MARRTKEEALATRERLLDAAERVFEERGVAGASLADIATQAGLTRGAVYWHFTDKADLFDAMMKRVRLPLEHTASRATEGLDDPLEQIRGRCLAALRLAAHDPHARRVFGIATHKVEYVGEMASVRDRHVAARRDWVADLQARLLVATRRGQIARRPTARTAAIGIHSLLDGLVRNWMLEPGGFDLVRVGREALDAYLAGLVPAAGARAAPQADEVEPPAESDPAETPPSRRADPAVT